ncbi:putative mitochondrial protein [Cardamine amara subsp. amara]|uniref:Mitochondrial protein n=1 Tax=Cardamine amara subsp. amara TaxID=228776 RepID=A0ABD1B7Z0_CARAN
MCKSKSEGGLGFTNLGNFKQALLAKQAWRLTSIPQSFVSRIYKARYYKRKHFFNACMGDNPSYSWCSILFGRELLEPGLVKSVGNGFSTSVLLDQWICDDKPMCPYNKQVHIDLNLMVLKLITFQGRWDVVMLNVSISS